MLQAGTYRRNQQRTAQKKYKKVPRNHGKGYEGKVARKYTKTDLKGSNYIRKKQVAKKYTRNQQETSEQSIQKQSESMKERSQKVKKST